MTSTHAVNLLLTKLPADARLAHRLPGLVNNLLSVAVLCDAGCEVFFHKHGCEVTLNGETILRGWRDPKNRLWRVKLVDDGWNTNLTIHDDATRPPIPLTTTPTGIAMAAPTNNKFSEAHANSLYECSNTHQLMHYYYACLNYPVPSTLLHAIDRGYFRGWQGLTSQRVRRHISGTPESAMGHLDQVRQGTRSTQPRTPTSATIPTMPGLHIDDHMADAPQTPLNVRTNHVFMQVHAIDGVISSDQTGRFPITSNRGNAYVVVFYIYDANYIRSIPIKSRSKEELNRAYHEVYEWLGMRGFKPLLHKMDNETSQEVEKFIQGQQTRIQYTPPDMHRTNPAERAIRTWKNHFLAGIAGLPKSFPIANWCRLTKQCDTTLNMLRPCRQNPLLSAHEALEGSFSFDATPMAPLGTEVLVHMKPNRRSTWGYHASKAWYLSHSPNHYRCIRVLMADTGGERITDTFRYNHHAIPVPKITATDRILDATARLTAAINGVQEAPPDELAAIESLRTLLLGEVPPPEPTATPVTAPRPIIDEEHVEIWSPDEVQTPARITGTTPPASAPPHRRDLPAIIEDDSDDDSVPPPLLRRSPRAHAAPSTTTARTHLHARTAHMINCIIAEHVLTNAQPPPRSTNAPIRRHGYALAAQLLQHTEPHSAANTAEHFIGAVIDDDTGEVLEYRHLIKSEKYKRIWERSFANELGRLFQGIRDVPGTDTCFFIQKSDVPKHKRATYGRIVCNIRPQKEEIYRTRLTVGGNLIDFPGNKSTPTADLLTAKLLINSTISTPGAVFLGIDLANFYLNTPMADPEYMRLRLEIIPEEIIVKYNLRNLVDADGWVYVEIRKGMYGLPQAGIIANQLLEKRLSEKGYYQCQHTPGLWRHVWRSIVFCLVVDNFGIKVTNMDDMHHLTSALEEHYKVAVDWKGSLFCGVKLTWDYINRHVTTNMPGYIGEALTKYQHPKPTVPQHSPYKSTTIHYGAKVQRVEEDKSPPLTPDQIKRVQKIVGTLLYYGRAVDSTLLTALSAIAARQSNGTQAVAEACHQLLDYVATHPNAGIRYHACDMILAVHTDASYLSELGGKSRAAGHFYLTNKNDEDFNNGAILTLSSIIKHVMSSASEAELAALYYGCKQAAPIRITLEEMGHPQPSPTPVTTDNITAQGLTMGTMTPKASKSNDQRFNWLKCRNAQRQFRYLWRKGILNRADYTSKHHPARHHQNVRPFYVFDSNELPTQ